MTEERSPSEEPPVQVAEAVDPAPGPPLVTPDSGDEPAPDALFEALWKRVLEAWDDDRPHVAILEHAIRCQLLPELAGRYRAQKDVAGHEERAKKKLDGIVLAATHMLLATKTEPRDKVPWQLTVGVGIVCAAVLFWLAFKILGHN